MLTGNARQPVVTVPIRTVAGDTDALVVRLALGMHGQIPGRTGRQFFFLIEQHHAHHLITAQGFQNAFHEGVLAGALRKLANLLHQISRVLPIQIRHLQHRAATVAGVAIGTHCRHFFTRGVELLLQLRAGFGFLQTGLQIRRVDFACLLRLRCGHHCCRKPCCTQRCVKAGIPGGRQAQMHG